MAAAMNTITTLPMRSPDRTTSRKRWAARRFTIRPIAASSVRFASGWSTGRSCVGSGGRSNGKPLLPGLDELENRVRQTRVRRIDCIHLGHMTVLRQHDSARASLASLAGGLLQQLELLDESRRIKFSGGDHQR